MTHADGPITGATVFRGKLYVFTATSIYRGRIRKRRRDKAKAPLVHLRKVFGELRHLITEAQVEFREEPKGE